MQFRCYSSAADEICPLTIKYGTVGTNLQLRASDSEFECLFASRHLQYSTVRYGTVQYITVKYRGNISEKLIRMKIALNSMSVVERGLESVMLEEEGVDAQVVRSRAESADGGTEQLLQTAWRASQTASRQTRQLAGSQAAQGG